jgi:uncharacterized membrane protein
MTQVQKHIHINVPVQKVYDYLAKQENQPDWIPSMVEVWDTSEPAVGSTFKWKYKMAGVLLEGETEVTEVVPNKRLRTISKGSVSSDWLFMMEAKDGGTELRLTIDYKVPMPVLGKLAEKIVWKRNEREADLAMENIKVTLEA